jgi:murein DD-endopeptidase MepM/ murein hydrolase activator NlpD
MVVETSGGGSRFFPDIRSCFRRWSPVLLSPWLQAALLLGMFTGGGAAAYLAVSRAGYQRLAVKTEAALAGAKTANADLKAGTAALRAKLGVLVRDRDRAARQAAAAAGEAGSLQRRLSASESTLQSVEQTLNRLSHQHGAANEPPQVSTSGGPPIAEPGTELARALDDTRQALQHERAQNADLTAQLSKIQADRATEGARLAQYKARLEQIAKELEELGAVHGSRAVRPAHHQARLGEIWQRLSQIPAPRLPPQAADGASGLGAADAGLGRKEVNAIERTLASAGVNVARILPQLAAKPAEGGPFTPPPKGGRWDAEKVSPEKLAAIAGLAKMLPLAAPLDHYEIGSPFGARLDPFNRRPSFHTGIDMDAPYRSPVYAPAPGTVIYAGRLGDYGKAVEIDHGLGIVTLYAHLQRYLVSVGQNVAAHAEIGLVGTTGRSTGPHVHYEIRVDGQPQDPEKFLGLAKLFPSAADPLTPAAARPAGNSR